MKGSALYMSEAHFKFSPGLNIAQLSVCLLLLWCLAGRSVFGDELKTLAGERLVGKVVSVSDYFVVFRSASFGKVSLARSNVVDLTFGETPPATLSKTNVPWTKTPGSTNTDLTALIKTLPSQPELSEGMSKDLLTQAGPEAATKFNQMLRGLVTGNMSIADLRNEAKTVRDQARALRNELGDEAGSFLDGYLAILDKFLAQAPAGRTTTTNLAR